MESLDKKEKRKSIKDRRRVKLKRRREDTTS